MSVEAFNRIEVDSASVEKRRAVEVATESIVRLRALIADIERRLGLTQTTETLDTAMVATLEQRLQELTEELQGTLAFLEEFDPHLYRRIKDIS